MDDGKRTVLVAALSAYAELLAKNTKQLDIDQGKGKGKATDDDVDLEAEVQAQIRLCGELSNRITDATSGKDIARTFGAGFPSPLEELDKDPEKCPAENRNKKGDSWVNSASQNFYSPTAASSPPKVHQSCLVEDEPYINPFTGLPVLTETGYEAGPSNRSPPALREPVSLPSRPLPMQPGLSYEPPVRKSLHSRTYSVISSQTTPTLSEAFPQKPITGLQRTLTTSAPPPEYGLIHIGGAGNGVATEHHDGSFPSYKVLNTPSSPKALPTVSPPPFDSDAGVQAVMEGVPKCEDQVTSPTHKNRYLRYITELASKALKATGSLGSTARTPSEYQPLSPSTRELDNVPQVPGYSFNSEPALGLQRESEENLPPAYDTLTDISKRPSLATNSSIAGSHTWTLSSTFSSQTRSSPVSPSANSSLDTQHESAQISRRVSYTRSNSMFQKLSSRLSTSLHRSISSSALPNSNQGVKERSSWTHSTTALSTQTTEPFLIVECDSPVVKIQGGYLGRRQTTGTASRPRNEPGNFADGQVTADAMLARSLARSDSPSKPSSPPGSNNPWREYLATDEEFARSLQLEEELGLQMERDMLLAHKIANGTADDGDRELAYFLHRESARLIESTNGVPEPLAQASSGLWGVDQEVHTDWLEAQALDREFTAQSNADEASFLEAKRLQEQFDQEAKNEEAWEEWKGSNIGQCTSCLEDHAREELVHECDHGYCNGCLQDGFKTALDSRAPFTCCKKALPIKECMGLSAEFVTENEEMMLELSTLNPMFCCNVQCAKFLPPRAIVGDTGECEKCSTKTCRHCRRRAHPGSFCAEDKETEAVKDLAKTKGWKTCPGCNHLIERRDGCLHMICSRCQTAFCYRCSKRWKDCESTCPDAISATHPKI